MQFLEDIKHKIGQYVFQRDLKHNKRHKSVCNLEDAKSIGILFEATTKEEIKESPPVIKVIEDTEKKRLEEEATKVKAEQKEKQDNLDKVNTKIQKPSFSVTNRIRIYIEILIS